MTPSPQRPAPDTMPTASPVSPPVRGPSRLIELGQLARLAAPLIVNNLALAGMGFADTVMAGRLGARDLAAVAVGNSIWMVTLLMAMGVLMALSPMTAHAWGGRRPREVGAHWRQAVWLALLLAASVLVIVRMAGAQLERIGIDPLIVPVTLDYLYMIAWGAPAVCLYLSLRFVSEGIGRTWPIMVVALVALATNVFGNWVFMFGNLGAPAMGAKGCALSTALTMGIMLLMMLFITARHRHFRLYRLFDRLDLPQPRALLAMLGLGVPISAAVVAEAGLFSVTALMMGTLGASVVAGHQVAMNYATTMFMVPLALSSATTIRVGQALGSRRTAQARFRATTGIAACTAFMALSAIIMLVFREYVVRLYTTDPAVSQVAISLLLMAALFQVADGLQVGAAGALRGYRDTRVPMALCLVAYWLVGFPLAWWLGLRLALGAQFVWIGVLAGLSTAAVLLIWRLSRVARTPVAPGPVALQVPAAPP